MSTDKVIPERCAKCPKLWSNSDLGPFCIDLGRRCIGDIEAARDGYKSQLSNHKLLVTSLKRTAKSWKDAYARADSVLVKISESIRVEEGGKCPVCGKAAGHSPSCWYQVLLEWSMWQVSNGVRDALTEEGE